MGASEHGAHGHRSRLCNDFSLTSSPCPLPPAIPLQRDQGVGRRRVVDADHVDGRAGREVLPAAQQRWARSIRYIVAHMQRSARGNGFPARECSCLSRLTRCSSVPIANACPRELRNRRMILPSNRSRRPWPRLPSCNSGWTRILMPGCVGGTGRRGRREHLVDAAMAAPEDHAALADRFGRVATQRLRCGSQTGMAESGMPIARAVLRPRLLVGKEQPRDCGGRKPSGARPRRWPTCRRCRHAGRKRP